MFWAAPQFIIKERFKKKKERASLRCKHHIHTPEDAAERVKQEMRKSNLFVALVYYTINNKNMHVIKTSRLRQNNITRDIKMFK